MITLCENEATRGSAPTLTPGLTHLLDLSERQAAVKATRACSVDGCERPHRARGWCHTHWTRWKSTGVIPTTPIAPYGQRCGVAGCDKTHHALGWCEMHYERVMRHGDPGITRAGNPGPRVDVPTMRAAHLRIEVTRGKASSHGCTHCDRQAADWAYDWSDPNELTCPRVGSKYSLDADRYMPLCKSCHGKMDWPHRDRQ